MALLRILTEIVPEEISGIRVRPEEISGINENLEMLMRMASEEISDATYVFRYCIIYTIEGNGMECNGMGRDGTG